MHRQFLAIAIRALADCLLKLPLFAAFFLLGLFSSCLQAQHSLNNLDKVRIQLKHFHSFQFAGYYAALEKGYYKKSGLDVELDPSLSSQDSVNLVLSGRAQYGVSGFFRKFIR